MTKPDLPIQPSTKTGFGLCACGTCFSLVRCSLENQSLFLWSFFARGKGVATFVRGARTEDGTHYEQKPGDVIATKKRNETIYHLERLLIQHTRDSAYQTQRKTEKKKRQIHRTITRKQRRRSNDVDPGGEEDPSNE